jgi:hypothetical protein
MILLLSSFGALFGCDHIISRELGAGCARIKAAKLAGRHYLIRGSLPPPAQSGV